jgi:hypothetical protein
LTATSTPNTLNLHQLTPKQTVIYSAVTPRII